ncbi:MAG: hypothetical protein AAF662_05715 [Pseudomonadota bacterium]
MTGSATESVDLDRGEKAKNNGDACYWVNQNNVVDRIDEHLASKLTDVAEHLTEDRSVTDAVARVVDDDQTSESIVGQPIRSFVMGDSARMLIETLLTRVRITGKPVKCLYRCDTPATRRVMEMSLTPLKHQRVRVKHKTIKEVPRATVFEQAPNAKKLVKHCCMCERVLYKGDWLDVEDLRTKLAKTEPTFFEEHRYVHTICSSCSDVDNLRSGRFIGELTRP